jgi:hypothetical protein
MPDLQQNLLQRLWFSSVRNKNYGIDKIVCKRLEETLTFNYDFKMKETQVFVFFSHGTDPD